jgi:peptidoglycan biosynthesis protein MviN/MurJ (putative lipid II flippase)
MEKLITIICNIILFLLLIFNVNEYADMVLGICLVVLICLFIFYLIRYRRKYIDKNTIFVYIICLVLQMILIGILEKLDIWKAFSGFMGLGGEPLCMLFYFIFHIFFISLIIVTNLFKWIIKKFR